MALCADSSPTMTAFSERPAPKIEEEYPQPRFSYSQSEIEALGRERPEVFTSIWMELGFCFALLGSMFCAEYFISGFSIILPELAKALHVTPGAQTWIASVFTLVTGTFLLPFGRLADMFGGYLMFNVGLIWFLIWTLVAGFSQNYIMLILCRALQGLGSAAFLPSGIMLLGSVVSASSQICILSRLTKTTVPSRTTKEPCLQPLWCLCAIWLLRWYFLWRYSCTVHQLAVVLFHWLHNHRHCWYRLIPLHPKPCRRQTRRKSQDGLVGNLHGHSRPVTHCIRPHIRQPRTSGLENAIHSRYLYYWMAIPRCIRLRRRMGRGAASSSW